MDQNTIAPSILGVISQTFPAGGWINSAFIKIIKLFKLKMKYYFRVLDSIFEQNSLEAKYYSDEAEAYRAVEKGQAWGRLILPGNFSKNFLKRLWSSIDADVETLNKSSINVGKC